MQPVGRRGKLHAGLVWMEFNLLKECIFAKWPTSPIMALKLLLKLTCITKSSECNLFPTGFIIQSEYFVEPQSSHGIFFHLKKCSPPPPGFWLPDYRETHI